MKKLAFLVIKMFLFSVAVSAEDGAKIKSFEVSFGDSAFTSGLNVATLFSLSKRTDMEIVGNSERFYITSNFKFGNSGKLSVDATGGVFKKLPWVGPRLTYYPFKKLMFLYWGGWSSGRIGVLAPEAKSFFQQFSLYLAPVKNVSIGYNIVKLDVYKTTQLPEIAYRYPIQENLRLGASATYDTVAGKPLFCVSLKYSFR